MSQKKVKTHGPETWARGTRGLLGPWATNQPRIENMRFAINGSLIPRPRFELYNDLTSETTSTAVVFPARYFDTFIPAYRDGYFHADTNAATFYESGSASAFATGGAMTGVSVTSTITPVNGFTWMVDYYLVELKGTTGITVTNGQTTAEAAFFPGAESLSITGTTVHQGRAFYWGSHFNASSVLQGSNRIWYSDAYDYTTFTSATQFFEVDSDVEGCASIGSNLLIWTITGDWYILQGRGDPADGTLNSIGKGRIPGINQFAARHDNELYFLSSDKTAIVRVTEGGLLDDRTLKHLGFDATGDTWFTNGSPTPTADSLANSIYVPNETEAGELDAFHKWNDVWTEETYGGVLTNSGSIVRSFELDNFEMLATFLSGNWKIYRRETVAEGPIADIGAITHAEEPDGVIGLPRISDPEHPVRVFKVIVDARYWKGTNYQDPALTITAADGKGGSTSFTLGPTADVLSGLANAEGDSIRIVGTPSSDGIMPLSHFADVTLSGLQSLAIEQVHVEYEVSNARNH